MGTLMAEAWTAHRQVVSTYHFVTFQDQHVYYCWLIVIIKPLFVISIADLHCYRPSLHGQYRHPEWDTVYKWCVIIIRLYCECLLSKLSYLPSVKVIHCNFADLLDMSLRPISQSWESGDLSSCGFSADEVHIQRVIQLVLSWIPLR